MTDLEEELRATLKAHERDIDDASIRHHLATVTTKGPRWGTLLPVAIASTVIAVVGTVGYAVWPLSGSTTDQPAAVPAAADSHPPVAADAPYRIWLSETVIPADGADVAAVLTGPATTEESTGETFGVAAELDRWDGTQWQPHRLAAVCMDFWNCVGSLYPLDGDGFGVNDIGLGVGPSGTGPTTFIRLEGLEPAWYRLQQTSVAGVEADGVFEVVAGDAPVVPIGPRDIDSLTLTPAVLSESEGTIAIRRAPASDQPGDSPAYELGDSVDLESWTGETWQPMSVLDLAPVPGDETASSVDLPALDPGAYRLVDRHQPGDAQSVFWVTADPPGTG